MEIGLNFNGDLSPEQIIEGSKIAETVGYHSIWIGEAVEYPHPFPIMALVCQETQHITVGSGIVSPQLNRCRHIISAFQTLQETYGHRFVVGLAPGDTRGLETTGASTRHPLSQVKNCVDKLRKQFRSTSTVNILSETKPQKKLSRLPIYVGASGPKMLEMGSRIADGVLLNYVHPEFLKWALRFFVDGACEKAVYGPTLLLPDRKNLGFLRIAAAIVLRGANKRFLLEYGLEEAASAVETILRRREFYRLKDYDHLLLEKFALCGNSRQVEDQVEELKALGMNEIVFATPLSRNLTSVKKIGKMI